MTELSGYELSRAWFNFCFDNPERVKPVHSAIYYFAIEHCNRLGWKEKFGFPSQMVMEAIGVKNWRTYSKALNEIVDFGFIKMIEISKNQYSSNIIAIVKNTKAHTKALDKALSMHSQKQHTKQRQSTVSIIKQLNKEQLTSNQISDLENIILKNKLRIGFEFVSPEYKICLNNWIEYKNSRKESYKSEKSIKLIYHKLLKLAGDNSDIANLIINQSIENNWAGMFELKNNGSQSNRSSEIQVACTRRLCKFPVYRGGLYDYRRAGHTFNSGYDLSRVA